MKRFLFILVALLITSLSSAQDIIVLKDGSTIQAKVIKVTQSEVEYKKFNNLEGPIYTISTRDLQCINYENGSKDTFVSPNYNPTIVTNETATQVTNDQNLLKLYNQAKNPKKKAKTLKTIGWVAGSTLVALGTFVSIANVRISGIDLLDDDCVIYGPCIAGVGVATWAALYFSGRHIEKKSEYMVQSAPIYQQEFKVGKNDRLTVGIDMLKDNTRKNQTFGLGVSYNF